MRTIIYPVTIDFKWIYQRPQQLFSEISKQGYKVIFYNFERYIKHSREIEPISQNFYLCKTSVPLDKLNIDEQPILWITYPPNIEYLGKYNEKLVVFDAIDEPAEEFKGWKKDIPMLIKKSDIIFTTAVKLYEHYTHKHRRVYLCPNAADFQHFNKACDLFAEPPGDVPSNGRPNIGYFGAIASWIEWDYIHYLSLSNPSYNIIMIGPNYNICKKLSSHDNIYFLGRKDYQQLPYYLQCFDVCLIPFKITKMTQACNPIKLYEYLSAGKPIVGTDLPELRGINGIYIGKTKEEFAQNVKEALNEKNDAINKKRMGFAEQNSWSNRASFVIEKIEAVLKEKENE